MTATIAFCSSIYTAAITSIADEYSCSTTVAILGVTTFLLGFALGPLIFAPLSETWYVYNQQHNMLHSGLEFNVTWRTGAGILSSGLF